jgi:hypothetical protein
MQPSDTRHGWGSWIVDIAFGTLAGGIVGAILAVNVVIYPGIDDGYEASVRQVFDEKPAVGVLAATVLVASPSIAVTALRRARKKRDHR